MHALLTPNLSSGPSAATPKVDAQGPSTAAQPQPSNPILPQGFHATGGASGTGGAKLARTVAVPVNGMDRGTAYAVASDPKSAVETRHTAQLRF